MDWSQQNDALGLLVVNKPRNYGFMRHDPLENVTQALQTSGSKTKVLHKPNSPC